MMLDGGGGYLERKIWQVRNYTSLHFRFFLFSFPNLAGNNEASVIHRRIAVESGP
ncbi:hypothetical protein HanRHA438_Chr13g0601221 [Helianthus annuus]|nr:hypothetical protein HanRHA438_Chr13g0601221 [Helianthus annuus]